MQREAARAWSLWEGSTSNLVAKDSVLEHFSQEATALSLARIECHYFMHDSFVRENQLLEDAHKLKDIPGVIVHGRYDLVCPMEQAWALHQAWPEAELQSLSAFGTFGRRTRDRRCATSRSPQAHAHLNRRQLMTPNLRLMHT